MEIEWNIPLIEVEGVVKGVIVDGREFDCTTSELINIYKLIGVAIAVLFFVPK